jgi:hypothetical protein
VTLELRAASPPAESTRALAAALLGPRRGGRAQAPGHHLLVLTGPQAGRAEQHGPEEVIGRGRGATISLPDPGVSRRHLRLRLTAAGAAAEDLGAKNGLRLNGVRVDRGPALVRPGDELTLGETVVALVAGRGGAGGPPRPAPRAGRLPPLGAPLLAAALLAVGAAALALATP